MRFDLELNMVNKLTDIGLNDLSVSLYPETDTPYDWNKTIEPMKWDTKVLSFYENNGNINTSNFKNLSGVVDKYITSGLAGNSTIDLQYIIDHNANKSLIFNGGDYYSHSDKISWSINTIYSQMEFKDNFYQYILDEDYDINSIDIFTIALRHPGYFKKYKKFVYNEYDGISIQSTFDNSLDIYAFTINNGIVYLNIPKIQYIEKALGKIKDGNRMFALPEFPYDNVSIRNLDTSDYFIQSGALVIKRETSRSLQVGEDVIITCDVNPLIAFRQLKRSEERPDFVIDAVNVGQRSIGFKSGTIGLYTSYNNGSFPFNIKTEILDDNGVMNYGEVATVEATITGVNEIPLSGKEVTINIISNNAKLQESNSFEYSGVTGIDGTIKATVNIGDIPIGTYIQKEWINNVTINGQSKGQITLPFRHTSIGTSDSFNKNDVLNGLYLYQIQSDDPILGKKYASLYDEPLNEYYSKASLDSYYINGRKIAYVTLKELDNKIFSAYIKAIDIEVNKNINVKFKNLFIKESNNVNTILYSTSGASLLSTSASAVSSGQYPENVLPNDILQIYEKNFEDVTIITYDVPFPLSNPDFSGLWLISDRSVNISSSYDDGEIKLVSNIANIKIKSIEAETPFLLSGYSMQGFNTSLGDTSYLTVTDYIKNPFGIRSCSYYCIYSDAINKKCIHRETKFRKYFQLDNENIGCIHTPEYDLTIAEELRCPGVYARVVDPFFSQSE